MLAGDLLDSKMLQRQSHVDHLGDGRRFFQTVGPERLGESGEKPVCWRSRFWRAPSHDLAFPLRCGVLDPHVQAAPAYGIAQPAFFVRRKHGEGDGGRNNCTKAGNGQAPNRENLKQSCLETVVYLIELIDE